MSAEPAAGPSPGSIARTIAAIALAVIAVATILGRRASSLPDGRPAPEFALPRLNGEGGAFRLSEHRGTPVVIEVMASWCGACKQAAPVVRDAHHAQRARPVRFLAVSIDDDREAAVEVARRTPFDTVHADRQFIAAYQVEVLPTFIVVDEAGNVRHTSTGAPSRRRLEGWLSDLGAAAR
ncbi:MAG: TlpA family protein disulfide reductase [Polyangiaceae bacterium]|nr:TlpA family protein disulfide reductase [Polyangiaceae bacterium]